MGGVAVISRILLKDQGFPDQVSAAVEVGKRGLLDSTHYIVWGDGVMSGEVTIETADDPDYAGTWAPITVVAFVGPAPKQDYVRVQGAYGAIRHRITVAVTGGTVRTKLVGS